MRTALPAVAFLLLLPALAGAEAIPGTVISGTVIAVPAGDRLILRTEDDQRLYVSIAEITAPRTPALLSLESQQSLSALCLGKAATLTATGTALDGTTIGNVSCGGVPASEHQVRSGLATAKPLFARLDSFLRHAQEKARAARLGVWRSARAASSSTAG